MAIPIIAKIAIMGKFVYLHLMRALWMFAVVVVYCI